MALTLLTGIPRSGTTLAAAMLDQLDDTVCLSEPEEHARLMRQASNATTFAETLRCHLEETRHRLLSGLPILDRRGPGGTRITNYFESPAHDGSRRTTHHLQPVTRQGLSEDVMMCAKHNALYAAALPELIATGAFQIVAMVRDPVAVLTSWRSLDLPVSHGKLPAAMKFWPEMAQITEANEPLLTKQIRIYDLFCRRMLDARTHVSVLTYEALIADCTGLAKAVNREISFELHRSWQTMIEAGTRPHGSDALRDAVHDACATKDMTGLVAFYPQYG